LKKRTKINEKRFSETWLKSSELLYKRDDHNQYIDEIINGVDFSGKGDLLEVGCGNGHIIKRLKEKCGHKFSITGLDISYDLLAEAKKKLGNSNLRLFQGEAEKLPFRRNNFDIIISISVMWYLDNPLDGFNEILRVLKPGGQFLVDFQNRYHVSYALDDLSGFINRHRKGSKYRSEKFITRISPFKIRKRLLEGDTDARLVGYYCFFPNYIPNLGDKGNFFRYFPQLNIGVKNSFIKYSGAKLVCCGRKVN
jgi:SAM-dependent methyltransferase